MICLFCAVVVLLNNNKNKQKNPKTKQKTQTKPQKTPGRYKGKNNTTNIHIPTIKVE